MHWLCINRGHERLYVRPARVVEVIEVPSGEARGLMPSGWRDDWVGAVRLDDGRTLGFTLEEFAEALRVLELELAPQKKSAEEVKEVRPARAAKSTTV